MTASGRFSRRCVRPLVTINLRWLLVDARVVHVSMGSKPRCACCILLDTLLFQETSPCVGCCRRRRVQKTLQPNKSHRDKRICTRLARKRCRAAWYFRQDLRATIGATWPDSPLTTSYASLVTPQPWLLPSTRPERAACGTFIPRRAFPYARPPPARRYPPGQSPALGWAPAWPSGAA